LVRATYTRVGKETSGGKEGKRRRSGERDGKDG